MIEDVCVHVHVRACVSGCVMHLVFLARHVLLSTQMFLSEAGISREELKKGKEPSACP